MEAIVNRTRCRRWSWCDAPWLPITLLGLLLCAPLLLTTCPGGHDIYHHLIFSHHFSSQLLQGDLYPRWLSQMNGGFGSPTFFFYPPIPYYLTTLFVWLPEQGALGCSPLTFSICLALILSGLTVYRWLREWSDRRPALLLALIYMVLPYHFLVDLYVRFSFAEFWSFVWMPLILYYHRRIGQGEPGAIPGLALSLALLIGTHLPTFLIFMPVLIGTSLLPAPTRPRAIGYGRTALGIGLGIALAAIYWLPAMTTQDYVSMPSMYVGFMHYSNAFLSSWPTPEQGWTFRRYLMVITVGTCLLGGLAWLWSRHQQAPAVRLQSGYWLLVALGSLAMTLPLSKPLWDLLPMLQKIQFPWRFNTVLTLAVITLLAQATSAIRQRPTAGSGNRLAIWSLLLAGLLATQLLVGLEPLFFDRLAAADIQRMTAISRSPLEYRPRWVPLEQFDKPSLALLGATTLPVRSDPPTLRWTLKEWAPRQIRLDIQASEAGTLTLHQYYYPGWVARRAEQEASLALQPSSGGLLQIALPAGDYPLTVTLAPLPEELAGRGISLLALLDCLWLTWRSYRHSTRPSTRPSTPRRRSSSP